MNRRRCLRLTVGAAMKEYRRHYENRTVFNMKEETYQSALDSLMHSTDPP